MPTYVFKKKGKKELIEIQLRISELESFKLKNKNLTQVPTAPSFRLRGTGWYETDFKTGEKRNLVKNDSEKKVTPKKTESTKEKKNKEEKSKVIQKVGNKDS